MKLFLLGIICGAFYQLAVELYQILEEAKEPKEAKE